MARPLNRLHCKLFHLWKKRGCTELWRNYMTGNRNVLKLNERGIFQTVFPQDKSPDLYKALVSSSQSFYCGFDPTAESLHIGNLLAIIALLHCHRAGHNIIAVLGGATAQIGDPSGKTMDRNPIKVDSVFSNCASIETSLHRIFANHHKYFDTQQNDITPIRILNNADWYKDRNVVEFLSTVGRYFRMGTMLSRQSVKNRLESEEGMSLTEFTYQLFQAYDWLHLYKKYDCNVQIGGNDQMGNIAAGHELISRVTKKNVFGLTVPLVKSTSGDKLGKTAGNAVWLNSDKTSQFELYQFFLQVPDNDIDQYLKLFTFYSEEEIEAIFSKHKKNRAERHAQKTLAENVLLLVHGEEGLTLAQTCTDALFKSSPEKLASLSSNEMSALFKNTPTAELYLEPGTTVFETVMKANCFSREVDAERVINAGGVHLNHRKVTNPQAVLIPGEHILPNSTTLIRIGKKNHYIVKWLGAGLL